MHSFRDHNQNRQILGSKLNTRSKSTILGITIKMVKFWDQKYGVKITILEKNIKIWGQNAQFYRSRKILEKKKPHKKKCQPLGIQT